jgi:Tfp pilus assembly protein PilO
MASKQFKLSSGTLVMLGLGFWVVVLAGMSWLLLGQIRAYNEAETAWATLQRQKASAKELANVLATVREDKQAIEHYFVSTETLPELIETIEQLGTSTQISFLLTGATVVDTPKPLIHLTFTATGQFNRLYQFLSMLDNAPYALSLNQASLTTEGEGRWAGTFSMDALQAPFTPTE